MSVRKTKVSGRLQGVPWTGPASPSSGGPGAPTEERSEAAPAEAAADPVAHAAEETKPQAAGENTETLTPLDYMLRVMRDPAVDVDRRDEMAKLALPYLHRKPAGAEPAEKNERLEDKELSLLEVGRRIAFALAAVSRPERKHD